MKHLKLILIAAFLLIVLTACSSAEPPEYSIQGTWDYTFYYQADGAEDVYDLGTFTFEGSDSSGTFTMLNIYDVEYEGGYFVDGITVKIETAEVLEGTFKDATHLSGTWTSEENDVSGTWEAVKQ